MASSKWLLVTVSVCGSMFPLQAQTSDWRSVEMIAPGTSISVVTRVRQGCELIRVTASELTCRREIGPTRRSLVFTREQVREVRLEETGHSRMLPGALIGAAVGGLVGFLGGGQSSDPEGRAYARVYSIPVGLIVGGAIGRNLHRHGPVIYRRA